MSNNNDINITYSDLYSLQDVFLEDTTNILQEDEGFQFHNENITSNAATATAAVFDTALPVTLQLNDFFAPTNLQRLEKEGITASAPQQRPAATSVLSSSYHHHQTPKTTRAVYHQTPKTAAYRAKNSALSPTQRKRSPRVRTICKIEGCDRRVRSRSLCKTHGGGKLCKVTGCKKSSQNGDFCIGHGGGRRCAYVNESGEGCTKAAQSRNFCKQHGGGARCKIEGCNKSSQGGGLCRAHGGGKRCLAPGCPKGAQRGNYCATHGGFRSCTVPKCVRTDRGGGFCEVHRRERLCTIPKCKRLSRTDGLCTSHLREQRGGPISTSSNNHQSSFLKQGNDSVVVMSKPERSFFSQLEEIVL